METRWTAPGEGETYQFWASKIREAMPEHKQALRLFIACDNAGAFKSRLEKAREGKLENYDLERISVSLEQDGITSPLKSR